MSWQGCKNILCIRPDNMGDLIMTGPAIRALKESFNAKITVLTSSMSAGVIKHMPEIDEAIIFDLPWVKTSEQPDVSVFNQVVGQLKDRNFDAAVVFTVYSQNPLPTAMLAYLAGIPRILAYCRENPYQLVTNWVPDKEPYEFIKHQVRRDLDLVATVGATTLNEDLHLTLNEELWPSVNDQLSAQGLDTNKRWIILHAGVSEKKREYPTECWIAAAKRLIAEYGLQILVTGSASEQQLTQALQAQIGQGSFSAGGMFKLDKFICLVKHTPLLLSVNTGTIHIAAAVGTPTVVLYAQTNPQHTPWKVPHTVLEFPVPEDMRSKNEVIAHVNQTIYRQPATMPNAAEVVNAVTDLLKQSSPEDQPFVHTPAQNQGFPASL
jgi:lipopolysaccharide heptosyltransferase II